MKYIYHICSLIFFPSNSMVRILKSIPKTYNETSKSSTVNLKNQEHSPRTWKKRAARGTGWITLLWAACQGIMCSLSIIEWHSARARWHVFSRHTPRRASQRLIKRPQMRSEKGGEQHAGADNVPMVEMKVVLNASSENRNSTQVLPTPESPISSSLNK